ncbi:hypothetical protein BU16DRAFT_435232, partial [Lophium mytilinum]
MPSLLLVVFVLQLALHLLNNVGASSVNQLLWVLYNKLPTPTAAGAKKQTIAKREVIRLKREMAGISAQDDFARWAKVRRQHDKAVADFEKIDASLRTAQNTFNTTLTTVRWVSTTGLRYTLQFWYTKRALFWIPRGWVPGYVEWILAFPRAPRGSISINVWDVACASCVALVSEVVLAVWALAAK